MKILIYLIISLLGFNQIPLPYLDNVDELSIDKQTNIVQELIGTPSVSNFTFGENDTISINIDNPYWDKIQIKGASPADFNTLSGSRISVIELPEQFLSISDDLKKKISNVNTSSIQSLDIEKIKDKNYIYIQHPEKYPMRIYKDTTNSCILHIDIAKSENPYRATVVLDPGHGGIDGGAGRNNINEKDIVLDITKRMEQRLKDNGINVVYTRSEDIYISPQERAVFSNKINPSLFISLHNNSSESSSPHGIATYIYTQNNYQRDSKVKLGTTLQNALIEDFNDFSNLGVLEENFCVIRATHCPSALIEFGFISNSSDKAKLVREDVREKAAMAITKGICNYFNN